MTSTPDMTHYAPVIIRERCSTWGRAFLASIIAQKRIGRKFSEKQLKVMQSIAQRFQDETLRGEVME